MFNLHTNDPESFLDAILYNQNKYFKVTDNDKKLIYTNKLIKDSKVSHSFENNNIQYNLNLKHYRSPEFSKDTDILFAGCSITWGAGIPEENIWSSIVAKNLGLSHASVALSGDSVYGQVRRIFAYFKEFGHPKHLYALFPDFYRMPILTNKHIFTTMVGLNREKGRSDDDHNENILKNAFIPGKANKNFKMAIKPFLAEEILNPEMPHFFSAQSIMILEMYCEVAGINFSWATWDHKQFLVLKTLGQDHYKTLVDLKMENWEMDYNILEDKYLENGKRIFCHEDLKLSGPDFFDLGKDRDYGIKSAHWGSHRHIHVAESFIERIKNEQIFI